MININDTVKVIKTSRIHAKHLKVGDVGKVVKSDGYFYTVLLNEYPHTAEDALGPGHTKDGWIFTINEIELCKGCVNCAFWFCGDYVFCKNKKSAYYGVPIEHNNFCKYFEYIESKDRNLKPGDRIVLKSVNLDSDILDFYLIVELQKAYGYLVIKRIYLSNNQKVYEILGLDFGVSINLFERYKENKLEKENKRFNVFMKELCDISSKLLEDINEIRKV